MSIQKKTLATLVALAVGASFGAAANTPSYGYPGGGYDDHDKHYDDGSHNTNSYGNQANDHSAVIDIDVEKKYIWKTHQDYDYTTYIDIDKKYQTAYQSNTTYQSGYTGNVKTKSDVYVDSYALSGSTAYANQTSTNLGLGLGLGLGVGLGVGVGQGGDGGNALGLGLMGLGLGLGLNDADGYGVGYGVGAGAGAGLGLAGLVPTMNLNQPSTSNSAVNVYSISMTKSGDNYVGNAMATHGINTQQGISGQSAMGQQSVNVNASLQF